MRQALELRELVFEKPFYRLVYGESDGLPGLVVDRFDTVLVVQITTAGMERVRDQIMDALETVLQPAVSCYGMIVRPGRWKASGRKN